MSDSMRTGRRQWLGLTAAFSATLAACRRGPAPAAEDTGPRMLGKPVSPYGERSGFEVAKRVFPDTRYPDTSSSRTPLQDSCGIITPSSLHYERHHAGVPQIDPKQHRLLIHGLVDRPTVFTVAEIRRLPSVSRIYFMECSGNTGSEWNPGGARTA